MDKKSRTFQKALGFAKGRYFAVLNEKCGKGTGNEAYSLMKTKRKLNLPSIVPSSSHLDGIVAEKILPYMASVDLTDFSSPLDFSLTSSMELSSILPNITHTKEWVDGHLHDSYKIEGERASFSLEEKANVIGMLKAVVEDAKRELAPHQLFAIYLTLREPSLDRREWKEYVEELMYNDMTIVVKDVLTGRSYPAMPFGLGFLPYPYTLMRAYNQELEAYPSQGNPAEVVKKKVSLLAFFKAWALLAHPFPDYNGRSVRATLSAYALALGLFPPLFTSTANDVAKRHLYLSRMAELTLAFNEEGGKKSLRSRLKVLLQGRCWPYTEEALITFYSVVDELSQTVAYRNVVEMVADFIGDAYVGWVRGKKTERYG